MPTNPPKDIQDIQIPNDVSETTRKTWRELLEDSIRHTYAPTPKFVPPSVGPSMPVSYDEVEELKAELKHARQLLSNSEMRVTELLEKDKKRQEMEVVYSVFTACISDLCSLLGLKYDASSTQAAMHLWTTIEQKVKDLQKMAALPNPDRTSDW